MSRIDQITRDVERPLKTSLRGQIVSQQLAWTRFERHCLLAILLTCVAYVSGSIGWLLRSWWAR